MLKERLKIEFNVLNRARPKNFNLLSWQGTWQKVNSITALHKCGTTACAGGYLALSKEWKNLGGTSSVFYRGSPVFNGYFGMRALYTFYQTATDEEEYVIKLIHTASEAFEGFYCKPRKLVTPKDVQEKLAILYFILTVTEENGDEIL
jgi:hypothetical protein